MTRNDLQEAGFIDKDLSDSDLGLLLLKYNESYLEGENLLKFKALENIVMKKYNLEAFSKHEEDERDFLNNCLAISEEKFKKAYFDAKGDNVAAVLKTHDVVVSKQVVDPTKKENIRAARRLAEEEDSLKKTSESYKRRKESLETLLPLKTDEIMFERFCKRCNAAPEVLKKNLDAQFENVAAEFLKYQEKLLSQFVDYQLKEDVRLRSYQFQDVQANA